MTRETASSFVGPITRCIRIDKEGENEELEYLVHVNLSSLYVGAYDVRSAITPPRFAGPGTFYSSIQLPDIPGIN